jgi:hypothetical protein
MSWEITRMSDWSAAGGVPIANLGPAFTGSVLRRELGGRGTVALVLDRGLAWDLAAPRAIVRLDGVRGGWLEARVLDRAMQTKGIEATRFALTATPRIYDLSDSDLVRESLGGRTISQFDGALTPRQYGDRFLFTNLAADRVPGIRWGIVEFLDRIPLRWKRWTRGQLLAAIVQATGAELRVRIAEDGWEEIDLLSDIGADAPLLPLRYGDLLLDHQISEDYSNLMTVARVAGEEPTAESEAATIAENLWRVTDVRALDGGLTALTLRAPDSDESPVLEDGMYVANASLGLPGRFVADLEGSAPAPIVASFAATGEVVVSGTAPSVDTRVQLVADAAGAPLETLELPSAVERYGYAVRDLQIVGGRGERQYASNGGHEDGLTSWSPVNSGVGVGYRRTDLGRTLTGTLTTARPAGTSAATPLEFEVADDERIYQYDAIEIAGQTFSTTGPAIPNTSNQLVLPVSPAVAASIPSGTTATVQRIEARVLTLDGNQPIGAPFLVVTDSNTDNCPHFAGALALTGAASGTAPATALYGNGVLAGECYLDVSVAGRTAPDPFSGLSNLSTAAPVAFTGAWEVNASLVRALEGTDIVVGDYLASPFRHRLAGPLPVTSWPCWLYEVTSTYTDAGGSLMCVVTPWTMGGRVAAVLEPLGYYPGGWRRYRGTITASGTTATLTYTREARTLTLATTAATSAASLTFTAPAPIQLRNWLNTDTITVERRSDNVVMAYTAVADGGIDPGTGQQIALVTLNTGASTIDDLPAADYTGANAGACLINVNGDPTGPQYPAVLMGISGGVATLRSVYPILSQLTSSGTRRGRCVALYALALTAGASWGTNARATLSTAAVPTGITLPRGARAWANWHDRATVGDETGLRLYVQASGGATSVQVYGQDAYRLGDAEDLERPTALYVVPGSTGLMFFGELVRAAATVDADGSGAVSVALTALNANTLPAGAALTIRRPAMVPVGERTTGSVLRLLSPAGGTTGEPLSATAGYAHASWYVRIPAGTTRQFTVISLFTLSAGEWFTGHAPAAALVDASGAILGWSALDEDGADIEATPGQITLVTRAVLGASGRIALRVYGGTPSDYTKWCTHLESFAYLGEATDAPYTRDSFSTPLMLAALRRLQQQSEPRITDRLTIGELTAAAAQAIGVTPALVPQVVLGGRVHLEDWNRLVRVTAIDETPDAAVAAVEVGQLARDGAQLLGEAAIAAGVRRIR